VLLDVASIDSVVDSFAACSPCAKIDEAAIDKGSKEINQLFRMHVWMIPCQKQEEVRTLVREFVGEVIDPCNGEHFDWLHRIWPILDADSERFGAEFVA